MRFIRPITCTIAASIVFFSTGELASAQTLAGFRFQVDNDYFDFWIPSHDRPDDDYTHGAVMRAVFNSAPHWARGRRADCASAQPSPEKAVGCAQTFLGLFQEIFTPPHDSTMPIPGERPYAGVLAAEIGERVIEPRAMRVMSLRFGTTGRPSGAEAAQKAFHHLADLRRPQGWDHQVKTQPVIGLTYGTQYILAPGKAARNSAVMVLAGASGAATNVKSGVNARLEARAGYNIPHPWLPSTRSGRRQLHGYLILGSGEEWVARNVLLEGNSPSTSGLVTKKPFVFESVWGLAFGSGDLFLEYRAVSHSREYETSPNWHRWGAISLIRGTP